jgi:uncharacterized membrane protein SirB2
VNTYLLAKHLHQAAAVILAVVFLARGIAMLAGGRARPRLWVTLVTHVNDTILLACALYMAWLLGLQDWVIAKLVGLAIFIALGIVALKRGRTSGIRLAAFAAALAVLAYLFAVALTKRVIPF